MKSIALLLALVASPVAAQPIVSLDCEGVPMSIDLDHNSVTDESGTTSGRDVVIGPDAVVWLTVGGLIRNRLDRTSLQLTTGPSTRDDPSHSYQCKVVKAPARAF